MSDIPIKMLKDKGYSTSQKSFDEWDKSQWKDPTFATINTDKGVVKIDVFYKYKKVGSSYGSVDAKYYFIEVVYPNGLITRSDDKFLTTSKVSDEGKSRIINDVRKYISSTKKVLKSGKVTVKL